MFSRREFLKVMGIGAAGVGMSPTLLIRDASGAKRVTWLNAGSHSGGYSQLYTAQHMNYFAEEGLSVDIIPAKGSSDAYRQVVAANCDIAWGDPPVNFLGMVKKAPTKMVYQHYNKWIFRLITLEKNNINSFKDIKGKRIGVISPASGTYVGAKAIISLANFEPEKDVKIVSVGWGATMLEALTSGKVDAVYTYQYQDYKIIARRENYDAKGWVIKVLNSPFDRFPCQVGWVHDDKLNHELLVKILRPLAKGTLFALSNLSAAIDIGLKMHPEFKQDKAFWIERVREVNVPVWKPPSGLFGAFDYDATKEEADLLYKIGVLPRKITMEEIKANIYDKHISEVNDFDHQKVKEQALNYRT
jgi:NitT/TauT family transport system substrate-binding protein